MRHISILLLTLLAVFSIVGCSNTSKEPSEQHSETTTNINVEDETRAVDVIPNPEDIFSNGDITTLVSKADYVQYQITNYTVEEYESYLEKCKDIGFDDIQYEGKVDANKIFYSYDDSHEYYLELYLNEENETVDIICKKTEEEEVK